jgi:uncharacterized membrane protein YwaF
MLDFLRKFFLYTDDGFGNFSMFSDDLGEGAFGYRHLIWMALVIVSIFAAYHLFKRKPVWGRRFIVIMGILLFFTRLTNQTVRAILGVEKPWTQAFPFHMCTVLTFLLPIVAVFNLRAWKTPAYVLGIMGGTITILNGDYFDSRFLSFCALEGMSAHMLLILIPVSDMAIGGFSLRFSESWKAVVGILVLMGWATLANRVFYPNSGANYMYLEENALPFGNDYNYFYFYVLIFLFFFGCLYGLPPLFRQFREHRKKSAEVQI